MLNNIKEWSLVLLIVAILSLVSNWVGYDVMPITALPGMLLLVAIALVGLILHQLIPIKVPSIAYIGIIGLIVTVPAFPGSAQFDVWISEVDLLALTTPILAYAGISIGSSWKSFAKMGWKALVVGMCVLFGTYIGSAIIAEIVLRIQGII